MAFYSGTGRNQMELWNWRITWNSLEMEKSAKNSGLIGLDPSLKYRLVALSVIHSQAEVREREKMLNKLGKEWR